MTVLAYGTMVHVSLAAALDTGIDAEVIDLRTLWPVDMEAIMQSIEKTGRCVIVHEGARRAGFGAEIAAEIAERALTSLLAPVERVTGYDTVMPLPRLEREYLPTTTRVVDACRRAYLYR